MKSAMKKFVLIALIAIMLVCLCGCDSSDYKEACSLMESGDYAAAVEIFTALGDYKDSAAKISECETGILENEYKSAVALMEEGKYSNAIDIFSSIDYKDSAAKIAECETAIAEQKYNEALALMAEENYLEAGAIFKTLDYSDSAEKYQECRATAPYEFTEIGDIISFGRYEQDYNYDNGPEELEWRVLDKQDGKLFIMSEKATEMLPYFGIYWKRSHIGGYLNYSYIKDFTAEEKAMIVETIVTADTHPDYPETDQGSNTEHGLHLLSVEEVNKYLPNPEDRVCYATDYLVAQFTDTIHLDGLEEDGTCDWWLRTAISNYSSGASIAIIGGSGNYGWATHNCRLALRPVCWIQLEG